MRHAGDGGPALVAEEGQAWDPVLLVRYPSRTAFSQLVVDPKYQEVTRWRALAPREAVRQPTVLWITG